MITIILAIVIAFIWGFSELYYKKTTNKYNSINILIYSYIFEIISCLLFVVIFDIGAFTRFNFRIYLFLAPIFIIYSFIGNILYFHSIRNGNLSIVSPILASDPVYVILIGLILFHEKLSLNFLVPLIIICVSICALNFVSSDTKKKTKRIAILLASLYAFVVAISTTLEKSIYLSGFKITDYYFHYIFLLIIMVIILLIYIKIKKIKLERIDKNLLLYNGLSRSGYFLYSYLLSTSYISIVSPLTGLYSVVTHVF